MPTRPRRSADLSIVTSPGRYAGEVYVVLTDGTGAWASGLWQVGHTGARPWVDLDGLDPRLLEPVAQLVGPGGAIMVAYGPGETERALRRKVPPAATPLGIALLHAGCRWMKDWYFAEGGREGHAKLQGELPLDDEHRARAEASLRAGLTRFLASGRGTDRDRRTAREARDLIDGRA